VAAAALRWIDRLVKSWLGLVTLVGLMIGAGAWLLPQIGGDDSASPPAVRPSHLSLVDTLVRDDVGGYPAHSRLEITLHNTGGRLTVVDQARITIRRVYELPLCFTQGDLPVSNTYPVMLSATARPGDVVTVPLHQQLGADEADRFGISFGVEGEDGESLPGVYLFEIDVSLQSDSPGSPLAVSRALVSLPETPFPPHYYWIEGTAEELNQDYSAAGTPVREAWAGPMPCWRSNTATIGSALAGPAVHSRELEEVGDAMVTPTFAAFEGSAG
jgi:hypothetical protein